ANSIEQLGDEGLCTIRLVAGRKQIGPGRHHTGRKTGAGVSHFVKALQKQPGPGKENETERDLDEYESRAQPRSTAAGNDTAAIPLERSRKIDVTRVNRRHEREHQSCEDANSGARCEHSPINLPGKIDYDSS